MSLKKQLFDMVIAGLIAGLSTFMIGFIALDPALTAGVVLASIYYFSRYPWGSQHGAKYNERIDDFYDEYLPL